MIRTIGPPAMATNTTPAIDLMTMVVSPGLKGFNYDTGDMPRAHHPFGLCRPPPDARDQPENIIDAGKTTHCNGLIRCLDVGADIVAEFAARRRPGFDPGPISEPDNSQNQTNEKDTKNHFWIGRPRAGRVDTWGRATVL